MHTVHASQGCLFPAVDAASLEMHPFVHTNLLRPKIHITFGGGGADRELKAEELRC